MSKYKLIEKLPNLTNTATTFKDVMEIINKDPKNMFWQKLKRDHFDNLARNKFDIGLNAWISGNYNVFLSNFEGDEISLYELGVIESNGYEPQYIDPTFLKLMSKF